MLGEHCIKIWSTTQGPYALSSAEAEFYAMIEGVTRAKGLLSLAVELGFVRKFKCGTLRHGQQCSQKLC